MGKKTRYAFLTIFCLLVSLVLRGRNYWMFPPAQDGFDEFAAAWQGMSLLKTGIPTSWSFQPYYDKGTAKGRTLDMVGATISVDGEIPTLANFKNFPKPLLLKRELEIDGFKSHFNIVQPDLEQPPLGGILISLSPLLRGKTELAQVSLSDLRLPFVLLGVVSTFLVIKVAQRWYGDKVAILSGFVYATVPTMVLGSRLALPENILSFLLLCFAYLLDTKRLKVLYFISFISPLIRPFGLAIPLAGAAHSFLVEKDRRKAIVFLSLGIASFLTYIIYGLAYDKKIFLDALVFQSQRFFAGPQVFIYKFLIPRITKIFLDGWIIFGWIAVFFMSFVKKQKKHWPILICIFSYILVLTVFGGEDYGWYRLPFYPFLAIAGGFLLSKILKVTNIFSSLLFILIPVSTSIYWGLGIEDWTGYLQYFRLFLVLSVLMFLRGKTAKYCLLAVFILAMVLNILTIRNVGTIWPRLGETSSLILYRR